MGVLEKAVFHQCLGYLRVQLRGMRRIILTPKKICFVSCNPRIDNVSMNNFLSSQNFPTTLSSESNWCFEWYWLLIFSHSEYRRIDDLSLLHNFGCTLGKPAIR